MILKRIILTLLIYIVLLACVWAIFVGYPLWEGFIRYIIRLGYDINNATVKIHNVSIIPIYPIFVALEVFLTLIPIIFTKRNFTRYQKNQKIALIIPCHKSELLIRPTLIEALKTFSSDEIYVLDNGNTDLPSDNTRGICDELHVNYLWCPIGSKAAAIYIGASITTTEYVMQIDDDEHIDDQTNFPITNDTHCIGYTISAKSHDSTKNTNLIQQFQDIEYKSSGIIKSFEVMLGGTTQFMHGAMSLWRRSTIIECLKQHPAYQMSDDWFLGYVASKLGYPIVMSNSQFHTSDVPRKLFNFSKFKCCKRNDRKSGYGSATLWNQRFSRWYRLTIIQVLYILWSIFFSWKLTFRQAIILKCSQIWKLLRLLFTNLKYILIVIYFITDPALGGILYAIVLVLSFITLLIFNFWQLKSHERFGFWAIMFFQFYKIYDNIVFGLGVLWSMFITAPWTLTAPRMSYGDDPRIKKIIDDFNAGNAITNINNINNNNNDNVHNV